jgi:threonine/homoserine/homoserine lactone efflux protein
VLSQFVDRPAGHVPQQMLLLALVALGIALVSDTAWVLAASRAQTWFGTDPRRLAMVGGTGGLAMVGVGVGVGVSVAATGRRD